MNHPEPNPIQPTPEGVLRPVPPEGAPPAGPYHIDGTLYYPLGSSFPTKECICCCRPTRKRVVKVLRNVKSPASWYLPGPSVEIGLCKKHVEARRIAHALTFSLLGIGLLVLIAGLITLSVSMIAFGALAAGISGLFRARESVQGKKVDGDLFEVRGSCQAYVWQLPELDPVEPIA